jgi:hypothetical protein
MKVLLISLFALGKATVDIESSSLLQSKMHKDRSDQVGPLFEHAAAELASLGIDASDAQVTVAVADFSQKLKSTAISILQMPQTEQEALLRRASQGTELSDFVKGFVSLPADVRKKVTSKALGSPEINEAYDSLPESDQQALLMQLETDLDKATTGKSCHKVWKTNDRVKGGGEWVRECTTTSRSGNGGTTYRKWSGEGQSGTETTTTNKDGDLVHRHQHVHRHNGQGGNAKTDTTTQGKNGYLHQHGTAHHYNKDTGRTDTSTNTHTRSDFNGHEHSHGHSHSGGMDGKTHSGTSTHTKSDGHEHSHGHSHDHRSGEGSWTTTDTDTKGAGLHHSHHHHTQQMEDDDGESYSYTHTRFCDGDHDDNDSDCVHKHRSG